MLLINGISCNNIDYFYSYTVMLNIYICTSTDIDGSEEAGWESQIHKRKPIWAFMKTHSCSCNLEVNNIFPLFSAATVISLKEQTTLQWHSGDEGINHDTETMGAGVSVGETSMDENHTEMKQMITEEQMQIERWWRIFWDDIRLGGPKLMDWCSPFYYRLTRSLPFTKFYFTYSDCL